MKKTILFGALVISLLFSTNINKLKASNSKKVAIKSVLSVPSDLTVGNDMLVFSSSSSYSATIVNTNTTGRRQFIEYVNSLSGFTPLSSQVMWEDQVILGIKRII